MRLILFNDLLYSVASIKYMCFAF